jgi:hypothetical protein
MDKCSGATRIAVVSFDVSRAFDTISHARLLDHLRERFEVPLYARRCLHSFLVGRVQRVRVGSAYSANSSVLSGTVQGSAIGPVLYTAATAGLNKVQLSTEASIPVYADDILLIKRVPDGDSKRELHEDCDAIVRFLAD